MDLLESVLRTSGAEKYIKNFRQAEVDVSSLKIITEQDLILLGVDNSEIRINILNTARNLILKMETKNDMIIDTDYQELILNQIDASLNIHRLNMVCASNRQDVINAGIELTQASDALERNLKIFEDELKSMNTKETSSKIWNMSLALFLPSVLLGVILGTTLMKRLI